VVEQPAITMGPTCPRCRGANAPGAEFCRFCGTPLVSAPMPRKPAASPAPAAAAPAAPAPAAPPALLLGAQPPAPIQVPSKAGTVLAPVSPPAHEAAAAAAAPSSSPPGQRTVPSSVTPEIGLSTSAMPGLQTDLMPMSAMGVSDDGEPTRPGPDRAPPAEGVPSP